MSETQLAIPATDPNAMSRPWLGQVWQHAMRSRTARMGVAWLAIVAFGAMFAPLLANSHPIAMKVDGRWSSPLWTYLTAVDLTLLLLGIVGVPFMLSARSFRFATRLRWLLG